MFSYCADPASLEGLTWFSCYLTSGTHLAFYWSFLVVIFLLLVTAPAALLMGLGGAMAMRSPLVPLRGLGWLYTSTVRGIPDIIFFLFVPIAIGQGIEVLMHQVQCPDWQEPIRQGNDFLVCPDARVPSGNAPQWVHNAWGLGLAVLSFALVFGAFVANTLYGAMRAVPRAQVETAEAYGMTRRQAFFRIVMPQMWIFALPGLSNIWMILLKATPLLFLLGVQDIVYWARELGAQKTSLYSYPHPDWRIWYFLVILVFYLVVTWLSERFFNRLTRRLSLSLPTAEGAAARADAARREQAGAVRLAESREAAS